MRTLLFFCSSLILTLALALSLSPCRAQVNNLQLVQVKPPVYCVYGQGGNIGVLSGPEGILLIDDQFSSITPSLKKLLKGLDKGSVRLVINTHWHGDHTGANQDWAADGALILAHENVRIRLSAEEFSKKLDGFKPNSGLPVLTFTDSVTLHFNGQTLKIYHFPNAHTDGDAVIFFQDLNVLHTGDLFFSGMYPFLDHNSGGSYKGLISALDALLEFCNEQTQIIPGHGPVSNKRELEIYRNMIYQVYEGVRRALEAGNTPEQIKNARLSKEFDEKYGSGFITPDKFMESILDEFLQ